jgi:hypothetical protein
MLVPYAAAQCPKKVRLAGAGGAIDNAANRAIGIESIETSEIPQDSLHTIVIESDHIVRRVAPDALL